ncbi:hypothetical protein KVF89_23270 [Nocardioides carbamazepini]|jgi:hypothetical protein|uniref:hypothetical protein n=1 Tax=Nocardioides carbamazepini TaxID=2854259 RepID=UPI00214A4627|nr:hypothetical protein [Nocardioides carbamazepini]MCR1785478.1 hypothetical protein [Nocardioides carbamazepini]
MRPLHLFAFGLVLVALELRVGDWDLLPGPLGWLLTLLAVHRISRRTDLQRTGLIWALGLATVAAAALTWLPVGADWVEDAEDAVRWAVGLPAMLYSGLVCIELSRLARADSYSTPTGLLQWTGIGFFVSGVAPVLIIGGGQSWLEVPALAVNALAQLSLFVLCLVYGARAWAGVPVTTPPDVVSP